MISRLASVLRPSAGLTRNTALHNGLIPNVICKRWSGHNAMPIEPSKFDWMFIKNLFHFWFCITAIPLATIATIINIRANPELTEIPDGYEPAHWEYEKHPITRFIARYLMSPMELEHELKLAALENAAESQIMILITRDVEESMRFYNDHRSKSFFPAFGEYFRRGRDVANWQQAMVFSVENRNLDVSYNKDRGDMPPVEGYIPEGFKKDN